MTTSSDSITQPAALAALGTFLVAFVAGLAWLAVREARRPWPPRRDLNGHLIKEDEFKDEKVSQYKQDVLHEVTLLTKSRFRSSSETTARVTRQG